MWKSEELAESGGWYAVIVAMYTLRLEISHLSKWNKNAKTVSSVVGMVGKSCNCTNLEKVVHL